MSKIAFYINCITGGGAERVITNLANNFSEKGYDVILVTSFKCNDEYPVSNKIQRVVLDNNDANSVIQRNVGRVIKLRKILKRESVDLLITFMAEPNYRGLVATIGLKTKNIISVRTDPSREYAGKLGRLLSCMLLPTTNGCVFQTEEAKKWFPTRLQKKSNIIFNEVRGDFFDTLHSPTPYLVVTSGRLVEKKNNDMVIDAVVSLKKKYPLLKLYIYGDGPLKEHLMDKIQAKNANKYICLKGRTDKVAEALSEASVFVLSSDFEGAPNSLMEAMAIGVPAIATDCPCGGPAMLIEDKKNGILIPVRDTDKLIIALDSLLGNPNMQKYIGVNAKKSAEEFAPQKVQQQWINYVESILR